MKLYDIRKLTVLMLLSGFVFLTSCSNVSGAPTEQISQIQGVSRNQIDVGGIASLSGPVPADFAPIFDGVQAYFNMVNASGGIYGRRINLVAKLDDGSDPSQNLDQAKNLLYNYKVFAVVGVATPVFAAASLLSHSGVPTFGMAINPGWSPAKNMFGVAGSYVNFTAPETEVAYIAQQVHATKAAVLAYNVSESQQGCIGAAAGLKKFGIDVVYEDTSIPAPAVDLTADVNRIAQSGAQFVASCMDISGNLLLSQTIQQIGLRNITQYWFDGYDLSYLMNQHDLELMQGVYFLIQHAPFSVAQTNPQAYPGMVEFLDQLHKLNSSELPSEAAIDGWLSADLFVQGLRAAGPNITMSKLINTINNFHAYTGNGLLPPVNWEFDHSGGNTDCEAFVQVQGNEFVPRFGSGGSVFTCFKNPQPATNNIVPLPGIPGLPGLINKEPATG